MTKSAGRPPKYTNADQLFANCSLDGTCFIWPSPPTSQAPVLGPESYLSKKFHTVGIPRIVFSIVRFFPAGGRLVRWCNNRYCINPYHYTEAGIYVEKRAKMQNPRDLLPEQEVSRHLLGPSDEEIEAMRPTNVDVLRVLADSAAQAGPTRSEEHTSELQSH